VRVTHDGPVFGLLHLEQRGEAVGGEALVVGPALLQLAQEPQDDLVGDIWVQLRSLVGQKSGPGAAERGQKVPYLTSGLTTTGSGGSLLPAILTTDIAAQIQPSLPSGALLWDAKADLGNGCVACRNQSYINVQKN
jgi:hypothetical protein